MQGKVVKRINRTADRQYRRGERSLHSTGWGYTSCFRMWVIQRAHLRLWVLVLGGFRTNPQPQSMTVWANVHMPSHTCTVSFLTGRASPPQTLQVWDKQSSQYHVLPREVWVPHCWRCPRSDVPWA